MIRFSILALVLSAGLAVGQTASASGQMQAGTLDSYSDAVHERTCRHYVNRARFHARTNEAGLEVILADSCVRAFKSLYNRFDTSPYEIKRARGYLDRLAAFKMTIIQMNMDRMFGKGRSRRTQMQTPAAPSGSERQGIQPITSVGEYLIAREMGVIMAYRDWADVTDFSIAEGE